MLIFAFGPRKVRAVTHLDVSRQQCARAAEILAEIIAGIIEEIIEGIIEGIIAGIIAG